jgi:DNA polymerase-3 subunit epsilon
MQYFAVFDLETTGLSVTYNHRVVEAAIVLVDAQGRIIHEWDTLLNPERSVAATHVHGIRDEDVASAPLFAEIAGEVVALLQGNVPVAHNLAFDAPFLINEFQQMGVKVPLGTRAGLCTMQMARLYLPHSRRSLEACCAAIGYRNEAAHSALADARATATLLAFYMSMDADFMQRWADVIDTAPQWRWPVVAEPSRSRLSRMVDIVVEGLGDAGA